MSKFFDLANNVILEARKSELTYEERRVKDSVDAVLVEAPEGIKEELQTLADGIIATREIIDEYTSKYKDLQAEAKKRCNELFDEGDKVLTRSVILTKDVMRLTKVVPKIKKVTDTKALEKLVLEIAKLCETQQDAISKQIKEMIEACEYVSEEMTKPAEKILVDKKELVTEGITDFVKRIANKLTRFKDAIVSFIEKFDKNEEKIADKLAEAKEIK